MCVRDLAFLITLKVSNADDDDEKEKKCNV